MKKLKVISWIIIIIGLVSRIFHYPASEIMILGITILLTHNIIYLIKNAKKDLSSCLLNLTISLWTFYLIFRIQFWGSPVLLGFPIIFIIPFVLTASYFIRLFIQKEKIRTPQILFILYFTFSLIISYTHAYTIFYIFNINTLESKESTQRKSRVWDIYSWYLYIGKEQENAINANKKAQKTAMEYFEISQDSIAFKHLAIIREHGKLIEEKTWTNP
jgi:hypothetical protein